MEALGQMLDPPMTKDAVAGRIQRLLRPRRPQRPTHRDTRRHRRSHPGHARTTLTAPGRPGPGPVRADALGARMTSTVCGADVDQGVAGSLWWRERSGNHTTKPMITIARGTCTAVSTSVPASRMTPPM